MKVFKIAGRDGKKSANWYGKIKAGRKWRRVKLFTDKAASVAQLVASQREADKRAAGLITADTDKLALPIRELAKVYLDSLRAQNKDADHVRISEWMLNRLIDAGKWQTFRDITVSGVESMLPTLAQTASYQNKFIVRAKGFVHWALPDGWADPLRRLRRVKEKGAKRTRERRAGIEAEVRALFAVGMPADRKLAYALAAFNGLRRNEATDLTATNLHLDAPIPFVGLLQKQGQDDSRDYIPLHPYVLKLLTGRLLMPGAKLLRNVPDMKTMKRDLERAGVDLKDQQGRRLDYHALRHTFQTNLDRTGCSRATKKRLMRHAHEDVTDGYAHAELAEMFTALTRLQFPDAQQQAAKTGTNDAPTDAAMTIAKSCEMSDHLLDQTSLIMGQSVASTVTNGKLRGDACRNAGSRYNRMTDIDLHSSASTGREELMQVISGQEVRPSTQVD